MPYEVKLHPQAVGFLNSCLPEIRDRIKKKLQILQENPFHYLEHFEGDYYKLRIGDYRALIDVDFKLKVIKVQVLDHRKRVYK